MPLTRRGFGSAPGVLGQGLGKFGVNEFGRSELGFIGLNVAVDG